MCLCAEALSNKKKYKLNAFVYDTKSIHAFDKIELFFVVLLRPFIDCYAVRILLIGEGHTMTYSCLLLRHLISDRKFSLLSMLTTPYTLNF